MKTRQLTVLGLVVLAGCSLIAKADLKGNVGDACNIDSDCQALICGPQKTCTATCHVDTDCPSGHACTNGACLLGCRSDSDCTSAQSCVAHACVAKSDAGNNDSGPPPDGIKVAALFPGSGKGNDAWTTANEDGLTRAIDAINIADGNAGLPLITWMGQDYQLEENVRKSADYDKYITQTTKAGASVIITASPVGYKESITNSPQFLADGGVGTVKFVLAGASSNGATPNVGAYNADTDPAWYVAGRFPGQIANGPGHKCIGLVLPRPTKQIIREVNAFTFGVRHQSANAVKVVVRWVGATVDPNGPSYGYVAKNYPFNSANDGQLTREELLTAQLLDLGCAVVGHRTETQRVVNFVEKFKNRAASGAPDGGIPTKWFSIASDFENACSADFTSANWIPSCLEVPYWNWTATYHDILTRVVNGTWTGEKYAAPFTVGAQAAFSVNLQDNSNVTGINHDLLDTYLGDAANLTTDGIWDVNGSGQITFNGQRDTNGDGVGTQSEQTSVPGIGVPPDERARMCWFVNGVYELPDPKAVDYSTLIPALVPDGPAPFGGGVYKLDANDPNAITKYGDVIDFVNKTGGDPKVDMSCTLD